MVDFAKLMAQEKAHVATGGDLIVDPRTGRVLSGVASGWATCRCGKRRPAEMEMCARCLKKWSSKRAFDHVIKMCEKFASE